MKADYQWIASSWGFEDSIRCFGSQYKADPRPFDKMHYHNHVELLYGMEGVATAAVGSKLYRFGKGDMLIVNSKYAHDVICEKGRVKYYVVQFLPEGMYLQGQSLAQIRYLFPLWEKELDHMPLVTAEELEINGMDVLVRNIMSEWEQKKRGYEAMIYADIIKIFISMIRYREPDSRERPPITGELQSALAHAVEAARNNLCDFSAAEAARCCNLSYSYFCRSFKKAYGVSFSSYLESVRLREAERLLLTTKMDISEIAENVGFATVSYFIERFRLSYGITPRTFRSSIGVTDATKA